MTQQRSLPTFTGYNVGDGVAMIAFYGGHPFRYIENARWITENFPKDVTIIGGHGPVYTMDEFIAHNETLEETIKVIEKEKNKGKSLEQLQEANILDEWSDYGWDFISVDRWIETIYDGME